MLEYLVAHFFAGLWTLIWHFGVGIGVIILLCVGAYFSPLGKKWFIIAAVVVAAFVAGEGFGVNLEKRHTDAQAATVTKYVKKVVTGTQTKKSRASTDPWNQKTN